ncbi:hypothetical protein BD779DRAFT_1619135 [Infundibulicybe gibba]|nr:hypothetical protein BD779DRAFT_1619135 [Infundibulicybe gibba]
MADSLDALADALNAIAENPSDIKLHLQHVRHAEALGVMGAEVISALEMLSEFLAMGEDYWLKLLSAKEKSVDLDTSNGLGELFSLYQRAEADYLSIPILQKHLQFILERHAHYSSGENEKPAELNELFSAEWTRAAIAEVVSQGAGHLTQSHLLWDAQRDWELEALETASEPEKSTLIEHVQLLHLNRLRQPHSNSDETFQSYSSFTTNYKPPQDYEPLLVAASKIRSQAAKSFGRREQYENAITQSNSSLEAFASYIAAERRYRTTDLFILKTVYERAIAEAAKRQFSGDASAEAALRIFWAGYCDSMRICESDLELETVRRAIRSVPGSGDIWSKYIRCLERTMNSDPTSDAEESVADIYMRAFNIKAIQQDVEQIVPLVLARAGYEKRQMETGNGDDDTLPTLIGLLESGIEMVHLVSKTGDPKLRLEKYLSDIYLRIAGLPSSTLEVWEGAAKFYKNSYLVWISYTDALIKCEHYDQARSVFQDIHMKQIDWPEAIWEAWITFEHLHGSVDDILACLDKVEKAQSVVNIRRAKEAEKASYQLVQTVIMEQEGQDKVAESSVVPEVPMAVDAPHGRGTKRSAEDSPQPETHKKTKIERKPMELKRDRENSTVFVANLQSGISEDELAELFKDCGRVREVKITHLGGAVVATVEFFERDSIPAALTKDKKRLHDQEVAVHLAWKSTLYVTNFPESTDDTFMRDLFGKYGTIFDVRWPSKKFKNSRRFCYIQFTSPASAESALQLHGHELEPNLPMSVLISNPERKKERTDQDANEREIYVAGLSRFTTKIDLEKLFKTYGGVKEVRMATDPDGKSKGFAFVEFENENDARTALEANNHELKKRRIAVTLADSRARARNRNIADSSNIQKAEVKGRSIRIRGLPVAAQEGLLQQVLEKIAPIKRVEVFVDKQEALVELENAAEVGKLLLRPEPIIFQDCTLKLSEEGVSQSASKAGSLFVPRAAGSRPRAGLVTHGNQLQSASSSTIPPTPTSEGASSKGQDDFRKMLG